MTSGGSEPLEDAPAVAPSSCAWSLARAAAAAAALAAVFSDLFLAILFVRVAIYLGCASGPACAGLGVLALATENMRKDVL